MRPARCYVSVRSGVAGAAPIVRFEHDAPLLPVRELTVRGPLTGSWEGKVEMTVLHIAHPSLDERAEHGRQAREHTPLDSHTGWRPAADRPIRSPCWTNRTGHGSQTWCRSGTAG